MKIFQASLFLRVLKRYAKLFPDEPLDVLLSLAYNQAERKGFLIDYRHMMDEIIGDSGAWSFAQGQIGSYHRRANRGVKCLRRIYLPAISISIPTLEIRVSKITFPTR